MAETVTPPSKHQQLQSALSHAKESSLPCGSDKCPSCDKTGLAILVVLYGVIPPQNFAASRREGSDFLNPNVVRGFDRDGYMSARPLNRAAAGGSLECSQYILRRLRRGYLHIYYPSDDSWEIYQVQSTGRLLRMQLDMTAALGKGKANCNRFQNDAGTLLLNVDPKQHPEFWAGFSDVAWTRKVRDTVAGSAANTKRYMTKVDCTRPGSIGNALQAIGDARIINDAIAGFQQKPQLETTSREAYPRMPMIPAASVYDSMITCNKRYDPSGGITGLILPLEDDVGIATQLAYSRNLAYLDIMGEGDGYTELDKQKMDTAALLDNIKESSSDAWSRIEDNINQSEFQSYREKFYRCTESTANFHTYSEDYTMWMEYLSTKQFHLLFDQEDLPSCGKFSEIVADLFEGCGLTEKEFNKVLLPQLQADTTDPQQLFWRGAAANQQSMLQLIGTATIVKTLAEGEKKFGEVTEQLELLKEIRAAKATAARQNAQSWDRLARVLASRARQLHSADPKAFRRTMRRVQALTLHTHGIAVLEYSPRGDATGYLQQLRNAAATNPTKIKFTPRNGGQIVALSELLVATWRPGEPMPAGLESARTGLNIGANELPPSTVISVESPTASAQSLKSAFRMNAGIAACQAFALFNSLKQLSIDLTEARAKGPNWDRLAKDLSEATASALGIAAGAIEVVAISDQLASGGSKTARFWKLSLTAGKISLLGSTVEGGFQVYEGYSLWAAGDDKAGISKGLAGITATSSGFFAYAATRMLARQALERAALGTAAEIAVGAAAASTAARGGAVVAMEAPPVALWLGIASAGLFVVSLGADWYSKYLTTTPLEKWADRSFLGNRTGKWGAAFNRSDDQLYSLLRQLYAIQVEKPSVFDLRLKFEIAVPVWGLASEIEFKIKQNGRVLRWYRYHNAGAVNQEPRWKLQLQQKDSSDDLEGYGEAAGEGARFTITIGDQSLFGAVAKSLILPVLPTARTISGLPSIELEYWPNRAAYPNFMIDDRSAEDVEKEEAVKVDKKGK